MSTRCSFCLMTLHLSKTKVMPFVNQTFRIPTSYKLYHQGLKPRWAQKARPSHQNIWKREGDSPSSPDNQHTRTREQPTFAYELFLEQKETLSTVHNSVINPTNMYRYLAIYSDPDLTWNYHINLPLAVTNRSLGLLLHKLGKASVHIKKFANIQPKFSMHLPSVTLEGYLREENLNHIIAFIMNH